MSINLNIGVFSTTAAALLLTVVLPMAPAIHQLAGLTGAGVTNPSENIIRFDDAFSASSSGAARTMIKEFNVNKGSEERILLELMSPGGEVFTGKDMQAAMRSSIPIDTYVSAFAASMGADTFMLGERRYVDEDSLIVFHGGHSGEVATTEPVLERVLKHLENPGLNEDNSDIAPTIAMANAMVAKEGLYVTLHGLRSNLDMLKTINHGMVDRIAAVLQKTDTTWTKERVRTELFGDFKRDMIFTGKQLIEMGVATNLNAPNEEDYKSV